MPFRPSRPAPWLFVVVAAAVLWANAVPVPGGRRFDTLAPIAQLTAMRPLLTGLALVLAVGWSLAAWRRRWPRAPAVVLLLAAVAAAVQIAPRAVSSAAPGPEDAPGVTVLTANLLRSVVPPPVLVDLVRRTGADVVTLPETNATRARQIAAALTAARGERWIAESDRDAESPDDDSAGPTSLVVRQALGPVRLTEPPPDPGAHGQVRIRLSRLSGPDGTATTAAGPGPKIAAVHPLPPRPGSSQSDWRRDQLALRRFCRNDWIVGGDLNATIDHSPLRAVLASGCDDAAAETGQGLHATWTAFGIVRPAIDHVLTSGPWRPTSSGVLRIAGSDHRAVWARIVPRQGR
ncbi:endonuclease/exonuclease/phosphatase family protein [Patulibacter sp.]|uniref:endonuclease/exonuclease/phosphatase family protein n=1 Tax=Patulibacter sp. TaxID=1912859 RepID=UPI002715E133|nr:endonuclease/exonuclease/phosphatase family protein [Patulibacter sp.]MDO9407902.1 endonuclease/exonuclease/phosphatase family protein [Patulibacter sp.]